MRLQDSLSTPSAGEPLSHVLACLVPVKKNQKV